MWQIIGVLFEVSHLFDGNYVVKIITKIVFTFSKTRAIQRPTEVLENRLS